MRFGFLLLFFLLHTSIGYTQLNLLEQAEYEYFREHRAPRIGLEIELTGLTSDEIARTLQEILGGRIRRQSRQESEMSPITGLIETYKVTELHLVSSRLGRLIIKPEDNSTENRSVEDNYERTRVFEIVTEPIRYAQVPPLQEALDLLRARGGLGTADGFPVAIQVNVEVSGGDPQRIRATDIIKILRSYFAPQNWSQIRSELETADFRSPYLGRYTAGMMERLMARSYRPSNHEFFVDFMYRQSLELLGQAEAWTWSEERVRHELPRALEGKNFDVLLPVMKFNDVRVSAVLMYLYPNDWISQYLARTGWFHQYPILEFRAANSDWLLERRVKQFLGLIQASLKRQDPFSDRNAKQGPRCQSIFL